MDFTRLQLACSASLQTSHHMTAVPDSSGSVIYFSPCIS